MKQVTVFGVVAVMVVTAMARANITPEPICTASGAQWPAIDGDWIVWHDARNGTHNNGIYGYILSEPNEVPICEVFGNQFFPSVSGNVVVWQDERDGQTDIYAFDLLEREPLALPGMPKNDNIIQRNPKISGDLILYEHHVFNTAQQWVYNLYLYDMVWQTVTAVAPSEYTQTNAAIDGTIVVWMENRGSGNRIYWRDISKQNPAARVSLSERAQNVPAVSGGLILWVENEQLGNDNDIWGYDTVAGGSPWVVVGGSDNQHRPAICGSIVTFQQRPQSGGNFDIRAIDIDSGAAFAVSVNSNFNDLYPAISGRRIVWQRGSSGFQDIYMAELPTPTTLAVDAPAAGEMFLAGKAMEIMWYLVEGDAPTTVKIDYSTDGVNWLPVQGAESVPFADGDYLWEPIADVDSQTCRIRISDTAPGSSASAMSGVFTIFQCDAALTADLTGNCRVDIADFAVMAAQWLTSGNPYDPTWGWE